MRPKNVIDAIILSANILFAIYLLADEQIISTVNGTGRKISVNPHYLTSYDYAQDYRTVIYPFKKASGYLIIICSSAAIFYTAIFWNSGNKGLKWLNGVLSGLFLVLLSLAFALAPINSAYTG